MIGTGVGILVAPDVSLSAFFLGHWTMDWIFIAVPLTATDGSMTVCIPHTDRGRPTGLAQFGIFVLLLIPHPPLRQLPPGMSNDGHEAYPRYPSYTAHPYQLNDDAAAVPTSGPSSSSSSSSSLGAPLRQSNEQQVLPMLPTGLAPVPLAVPPQIQPGAVINGASGAAAGRVRSAIACALCRKQKMK